MKLRAAIALLALAAPVLPVLAQRGGAHAGASAGHGFAGSGFSGHGSVGSGFAGHAGFSARPGFSRPGGSAPSAPPFRYGATGRAGFSRYGQPGYAGARFPYTGSRFSAYRPAYPSRLADSSRVEDRESGRFRQRRREFAQWYTNIYPAWLGYGYPYTIDPGFFDWGDTSESAYGNSEYDQGPAPPNYAVPYAGEDESAAREQYAGAGSAIASAPAPGEPLTLVFKDGRAPVKVQNYMMTAEVFTDLDPQHDERIPINQIDVAATQRANSAAGVEFQVPGVARD